MTSTQRAARTIGAVVGGYAVVLFALFWRVWFRGQMSGWDCAVEYWPDLIFQVHALGDGEWPGWNPYVLGGYPYRGDPQAGLYAPASWLTWPLAAIGGDGPWLIQVKVLVNLLVGLCGMHAWTWARTRSHAAATVAALVFVLGSPLLVHKNGALLWPVLYWPWALLALERMVARPTLRRGALLGGGLWLVGAAGHPQGSFYGLVVIALYGVFLTVVADGPRRVLRTLRRLAPAGAVALGLAGLLLAATWLPARGAVAESPRANRGPGYVMQLPLEPDQLDELVVPNLDTNWMADVYVGPLALLGGLWLLIAGRSAGRRQAAFWVGVALLGLGLAMGRHGVLPWFYQHVPGFDLFRIAYRHKLIFGLAAAVLAGDAVAGLSLANLARWRRAEWIGLSVAWLLLAAALGLRLPAWGFAAAILAVAGGLPWLSGRRTMQLVALAALAALTLADLWHAGASKLAILQRRPDPRAHVAKVAAMEGVRGPWRYHICDARSPYGGTVPYHAAFLEEAREHSGYSNPIDPARHEALARRAKQQPAILRHQNVRYLVGCGARPPDGQAVAPKIVAVEDVAPLARWYGATEALSAGAILDRFAAVRPSALRAALIEAGDVRGVALPPPSSAAPVDGALIRFDRGEVEVEIDAPAAGVLVLAEGFAPGWTAEVDGASARVFRAHYALRAVVVPAGRSRVTFRYAPAGRIALPLLFLVGLAALVAAMALRAPWLDRVPGGDG